MRAAVKRVVAGRHAVPSLGRAPSTSFMSGSRLWRCTTLTSSSSSASSGGISLASSPPCRSAASTSSSGGKPSDVDGQIDDDQFGEFEEFEGLDVMLETEPDAEEYYDSEGEYEMTYSDVLREFARTPTVPTPIAEHVKERLEDSIEDINYRLNQDESTYMVLVFVFVLDVWLSVRCFMQLPLSSVSSAFCLTSLAPLSSSLLLPP